MLGRSGGADAWLLAGWLEILRDRGARHFNPLCLFLVNAREGTSRIVLEECSEVLSSSLNVKTVSTFVDDLEEITKISYP
eukprot:942876-Pyramimonas_sp.AAC.2